MTEKDFELNKDFFNGFQWEMESPNENGPLMAQNAMLNDIARQFTIANELKKETNKQFTRIANLLTKFDHPLIEVSTGGRLIFTNEKPVDAIGKTDNPKP